MSINSAFARRRQWFAGDGGPGALPPKFPVQVVDAAIDIPLEAVPAVHRIAPLEVQGEKALHAAQVAAGHLVEGVHLNIRFKALGNHAHVKFGLSPVGVFIFQAHVKLVFGKFRQAPVVAARGVGAGGGLLPGLVGIRRQVMRQGDLPFHFHPPEQHQIDVVYRHNRTVAIHHTDVIVDVVVIAPHPQA
jgi:hypothetical protein